MQRCLVFLSGLRWLGVCAAVAALFQMSACSTGVSAGLETFTLLNPFADPTRNAPLSPNLRYLRVSTNGKPSLFVLGYVDPVQGSNSKDQIWYSRAGEMLRVRDGRLVSMLGVPGELKGTNLKGPDAKGASAAWSRQTAVAAFERVRHLGEPGSYEIREAVTLTRVGKASPSAFAYNPKAAWQPADLVWFEEKYAAASPLAAAAPASLYGVLFEGQGADAVARVVYSEQCPTPQYCLVLQDWPSR